MLYLNHTVSRTCYIYTHPWSPKEYLKQSEHFRFLHTNRIRYLLIIFYLFILSKSAQLCELNWKTNADEKREGRARPRSTEHWQLRVSLEPREQRSRESRKEALAELNLKSSESKTTVWASDGAVFYFSIQISQIFKSRESQSVTRPPLPELASDEFSSASRAHHWSVYPRLLFQRSWTCLCGSEKGFLRCIL